MRQKVKMPISLQGTHIDVQTARLLDILERGKHRAMKEERILQICRTLLPPHLILLVTGLSIGPFTQKHLTYTFLRGFPLL